MRLLSREKKFFLIRHAGFPLAKALLFLLKATCRLDAAAGEKVRQIVDAERPVVFLAHGNIVACAFYARLFTSLGREVAVLTSPSRDGRAAFEFFCGKRVRPIVGSSSSGGARAAVEAIKALREGCILLMTVDGPRGPRLVPKSGPIRIAQKAGASVFCGCMSPSWSKTLGSWDRLFIPLPFSRIALDVRPLSEIHNQPVEQAVATVEQLMRAQAASIRSPILTPSEQAAEEAR